VALQQNDSHKPIPRIAVVFMASELKTPAVPVLFGGQPGHITWAGLLALVLCLRRFWEAISLPEGLVLLLFAANFLQWTVTPQSGLYYIITTIISV